MPGIGYSLYHVSYSVLALACNDLSKFNAMSNSVTESNLNQILKII